MIHAQTGSRYSGGDSRCPDQSARHRMTLTWVLLVSPFAGHLTVRDPEHPDLYWTNPMVP